MNLLPFGSPSVVRFDVIYDFLFPQKSGDLYLLAVWKNWEGVEDKPNAFLYRNMHFQASKIPRLHQTTSAAITIVIVA